MVGRGSRTGNVRTRGAAVACIAEPFDYDVLMMVERIIRQSRLQRQNEALKSDVQRQYPVAGMSDSLDDYFCNFVRSHEQDLTETELARRLGISRKTLWERRQKLGIRRRKAEDAPGPQ